jgi:hypothetical protein
VGASTSLPQKVLEKAPQVQGTRQKLQQSKDQGANGWGESLTELDFYVEPGVGLGISHSRQESNSETHPLKNGVSPGNPSYRVMPNTKQQSPVKSPRVVAPDSSSFY